MAEPTEPIRQDIDHLRGSMTETLEQIEQRVRGTVDTTVQNVRETFDIGRQVGERPWLSLGLAVAAGYLLGSVGGNDYPEPAPPPRPGMPMRYYDDHGAQQSGHATSHTTSPGSSHTTSPSSYGQGQSYAQSQGYGQHTGYEQHRQQRQGGMLASLLGPMSGELDTLTHAAMRSLMSMVRESLQNSIPQFSTEYERVRAEHMARDAASEMYGHQATPGSYGTTGTGGSAGIYGQGSHGSTSGTGSYDQGSAGGTGSTNYGTGSMGSTSSQSSTVGSTSGTSYGSGDASRTGRSDL